MHAGDELVRVHLSVGIADSRRTRDADELIREADLAMYQAKTSGKGRFAFFDPPMAAAMLRRHDLKEELAKAIERGEIVVEYQPIVDLDTGRISAAEALVRWEHPVRGRIGPGEFIPLAEESGLIGAIGRHVLEQTCRQARRWEAVAPGDPPLRLHVNLSAAELRDPDLIAGVRPLLEEIGVPPERLTLEITETELLDDAVAERRPPRRAARARDPDRARRLRHRLLLAELPPLAAARQPQDREAVRRRARAATAATRASSA